MSFEAVGGLDTYSLEDTRLSCCGRFAVEEKILSPRAGSHVSMLAGEV